MAQYSSWLLHFFVVEYMTEYNCSERLAIVLKFSYNYDNFNIKKENNMSVNESQIKNTTAGAIDDDDAVIFKELSLIHI